MGCDGDIIPNFYLEIVEFPTATTPGRGINCGGDTRFNFKFEPNCEAGTLECWSSSSHIEFSMTLKPITVGRSVVGFDVTFTDNPDFVAHYANNITEDIVCDIFAPPVYVEEFSAVQW